MATAKLKKVLMTSVATKGFPKPPMKIAEEHNLGLYVRQRLTTDDRKVTSKELPTEAIVSVWNVTGNENDMLELLEQKLSGTTAEGLAADTRRAVETAVTNRASSEANFAWQVGQRLAGGFEAAVKEVWHADEVKDLSYITVRTKLLEIYQEEIEEFPRFGTYTRAARNHFDKRKGIQDHQVLNDRSNELPQYFMVPGIVNGKSVDVARDWFEYAADNSPIGRTAIAKLNGIDAALKKKVDAPAEYVAMLNDTTQGNGEVRLNNMKLVAQREVKRVRELFAKACHLHQQLSFIRKEMNDKIWVRVGIGPRPIHVGPKVKNPETLEVEPATGTDYTVSSFLKWDLHRAIRDTKTIEEKGILQAILNTVKPPDDNSTPVGAPAIKNADEWLTEAMRLGNWAKQKDFRVNILAKLTGEFGSPGSTMRMAISDIRDACNELWPNIAAMVESDREEMIALDKKAALEKMEKNKQQQKANEKPTVVEQLKANIKAA